MLYEYWFGLNAQRKRLLKKMPPEPLKSFLSTPFPDPNLPINEVELLALDFETTGLNRNTDRILSIGYTNIQKGVISLKNSQHFLVNTQVKLSKENVHIHNIMDSEQATGLPVDQVIARLLQDLTGKVMLVHFAQVELSFLKQACIQLYGMAPVFPVIDTLMMAKRRLDLSDTPYEPSKLRLISLREEFKLPPHHEHNALNDALATAELFLAMLNKNHQGAKTSVKSVQL
ncbi:DNA polymerase III subunit epsilon [Parashewanella spongiae]|uniref:DNA polymerase III subunit epsilon n=1 Tax=Parashewanella spongiae TaxID=342950 RepID=A0A3A6TIM8_9GAMM|nr:exonuclease domain-containing protein [Parashewanella spongiae]MCL1079311.1 DNA polymerase III subunit epsilon [Parashewanella spongiae]RJY10518.1 DNA polymerase III subunit epsilon [Parashewanella spongiae]